MGDVKTESTSQEVPRDEEEVKELSKIQPVTLETDNSSLQSVDEAKSEGEERTYSSSSSEPQEIEEEVVEEQIEEPPVEETTPEVETPTEPITKPQNTPNKDKLAERLRKSIIYDI